MGINSIDNQHKKLIDLINTLFSEENSNNSKQGVSSALAKLVEYSVSHIRYEEDAHMEIHKKLVAQVLDFQKQFDNGETDVPLELMEFPKDWLIKHIKGTDKKYSSFLLSKGVS